MEGTSSAETGPRNRTPGGAARRDRSASGPSPTTRRSSPGRLARPPAPSRDPSRERSSQEEVVASHALPTRHRPREVRLHPDPIGREPPFDVLVPHELGHRQEQRHAVERVESIVQHERRREGAAAKQRAAVAPMNDARPRITAQAVLAHTPLAEQCRRQAQHPVVVKGDDDRHALLVGGADHGRREQREEVVAAPPRVRAGSASGPLQRQPSTTPTRRPGAAGRPRRPGVAPAATRGRHAPASESIRLVVRRRDLSPDDGPERYREWTIRIRTSRSRALKGRPRLRSTRGVEQRSMGSRPRA